MRYKKTDIRLTSGYIYSIRTYHYGRLWMDVRDKLDPEQHSLIQRSSDEKTVYQSTKGLNSIETMHAAQGHAIMNIHQ